MKIDFLVELKTLKGTPLYEKSLDVILLVEAARIAGPGASVSLHSAAMALDQAKVTLTDLIEKQGTPLILRNIAIEALMSGFIIDDKKPGFEKLSRYKLATRLSDSTGVVEVSKDEVKMIKTLTGFLKLPPIVVGQCLEFLEKAESLDPEVK